MLLTPSGVLNYFAYKASWLLLQSNKAICHRVATNENVRCSVIMTTDIYMTGFVLTRNAITEIQVMARHKSYTLVLSRHTNHRATGLLSLAPFL